MPERPRDRRHFTRIPFDAEVVLTDPANGRTWQAELIDISLKGALATRPENWTAQHEQAFELALHLVGLDTPLRFEARLVRDDDAVIAFHIEHMNLDTATHLHRLVELNLGDEALLERELAELLGGH